MPADDDTSLTEDLKANIRADFEKRYTNDDAQALQNCHNQNKRIMAFEVELASGSALSADKDCRPESDDDHAPKKKKKSLATLLGQVKKQRHLMQQLRLLGLT